MKTEDSDPLWISRLIAGDRQVLEQLYREGFGAISHFVQGNRGSLEDARDIFQEAIVIFIQKVSEPGFSFSSKWSTFLFGIARNLWLKRLKRDSPAWQVSLDAEMTFPRELSVDPELEENELPLQREALFQRMDAEMLRLPEDCRSILLLSFYEMRSAEEICRQYGYTDGYYRLKKHRCLEYLRKFMRESGS